MKNKLPVSFLIIIIYIFVFFFSNIVYAQKNLFHSSNWIIGCNNNNVCDAVGFSEKENSQNWYLRIRINAETKKIINFGIVPSSDNISSNDVRICKNNNICFNLGKKSYYEVLNDRPIYILKLDESYFDNLQYLSIYNNYSKKNINFNFSELNKFINNYIIKNKKNNDIMIAYPWNKYKDINKSGYLSIIKKLNFDDNCSDDFGFSFEVKGLNIIALCENEGFNPVYALLYDKINRQKTSIVSDEAKKLQSELGFGAGMLTEDEAFGLVLDQTNHYEFKFVSKGDALGDCGRFLTFVYDGRQFQLVEARIMPVCGKYILSVDWPVIYSVPYIKK